MVSICGYGLSFSKPVHVFWRLLICVISYYAARPVPSIALARSDRCLFDGWNGTGNFVTRATALLPHVCHSFITVNTMDPLCCCCHFCECRWQSLALCFCHSYSHCHDDCPRRSFDSCCICAILTFAAFTLVSSLLPLLFICFCLRRYSSNHLTYGCSTMVSTLKLCVSDASAVIRVFSGCTIYSKPTLSPRPSCESPNAEPALFPLLTRMAL